MKKFVLAGAFAAIFAAPVVADPSFGLGISYVFGDGLALGGRVFSTDIPQNGAVSLGVDYKFNSGAWRPNVGVAYLDNDLYVDLSLGVDLNSGNIDYGIGLGGLANMR